jgi:hypothetical protein
METIDIGKELVPIFDNRRSFYGKAIVYHRDDGVHLYSYRTHVCSVIDNVYGKRFRLFDGWDCSPTTLRHVKEFLRQHGFQVDSKKEIEEMHELILRLL